MVSSPCLPFLFCVLLLFQACLNEEPATFGVEEDEVTAGGNRQHLPGEDVEVPGVTVVHVVPSGGDGGVHREEDVNFIQKRVRVRITSPRCPRYPGGYSRSTTR